MRRKVALAAAAVAMVGTLAVGGTLAWFTDTETATNVVTTGNVDIAWYERDDTGDFNKMDGDGLEFGEDTPVTPGAELTKEAKIKNEGKNAAYIRAKITVDEKVADIVKFDIASDKWENGEDGYYYYKEIVAPNGGETELLIDSLTISTTAGNEKTNIVKAGVHLFAEAIQSDNIVLNDGQPADVMSVADLKEVFDGKGIVDYETEAAVEEVEEVIE